MAAAGNQAGGGAAAAGRLQAVTKMVPQAVPAGGGTVGQAVVRHLQAVEQVAAQQGRWLSRWRHVNCEWLSRRFSRQPQVVEQVAVQQPQAAQQAVAQMVPQAVPAGGSTVGQAEVWQPQAVEQVVARHLQVVEQAVQMQFQQAAVRLGKQWHGSHRW